MKKDKFGNTNHYVLFELIVGVHLVEEQLGHVEMTAEMELPTPDKPGQNVYTKYRRVKKAMDEATTALHNLYQAVAAAMVEEEGATPSYPLSKHGCIHESATGVCFNCCPHPSDAVYYNQYNKVTQCHKCGHVTDWHGRDSDQGSEVG